MSTSIVDQLLLFIKIVEKGSFSAVAKESEISISSVSRQFRQLEDHLGLRLLTRTTRKIMLTDAGKEIFDSATDISRELIELETLAMMMGKRVSGVLKVSSTVAFGKAHILPLIPGFLVNYPDLQIALELTDRPVDLVKDEKDIAIRFMEQLDSTAVIARKIATHRRFICASPAYLKTHGTPEHPDDLLSHNCLRSSTVASWNGWEFETDGVKRTFKASGNFKANSADAVYHAALAGLGIARLSEYLVDSDLASGKLVRLLTEYSHETADIMAVYPDRRNLPPKVRVFLDYLIDKLPSAQDWLDKN